MVLNEACPQAPMAAWSAWAEEGKGSGRFRRRGAAGSYEFCQVVGPLAGDRWTYVQARVNLDWMDDDTTAGVLERSRRGQGDRAGERARVSDETLAGLVFDESLAWAARSIEAASGRLWPSRGEALEAMSERALGPAGARR